MRKLALSCVLVFGLAHAETPPVWVTYIYPTPTQVIQGKATPWTILLGEYFPDTQIRLSWRFPMTAADTVAFQAMRVAITAKQATGPLPVTGFGKVTLDACELRLLWARDINAQTTRKLSILQSCGKPWP